MKIDTSNGERGSIDVTDSAEEEEINDNSPASTQEEKINNDNLTNSLRNINSDKELHPHENDLNCFPCVENVIENLSTQTESKFIPLEWNKNSRHHCLNSISMPRNWSHIEKLKIQRNQLKDQLVNVRIPSKEKEPKFETRGHKPEDQKKSEMFDGLKDYQLSDNDSDSDMSDHLVIDEKDINDSVTPLSTNIQEKNVMTVPNKEPSVDTSEFKVERNRLNELSLNAKVQPKEKDLPRTKSPICETKGHKPGDQKKSKMLCELDDKEKVDNQYSSDSDSDMSDHLVIDDDENNVNIHPLLTNSQDDIETQPGKKDRLEQIEIETRSSKSDCTNIFRNEEFDLCELRVSNINNSLFEAIASAEMKASDKVLCSADKGFRKIKIQTKLYDMGHSKGNGSSKPAVKQTESGCCKSVQRERAIDEQSSPTKTDKHISKSVSDSQLSSEDGHKRRAETNKKLNHFLKKIPKHDLSEKFIVRKMRCDNPTSESLIKPESRQLSIGGVYSDKLEPSLSKDMKIHVGHKDKKNQCETNKETVSSIHRDASDYHQTPQKETELQEIQKDVDQMKTCFLRKKSMYNYLQVLEMRCKQQLDRISQRQQNQNPVTGSTAFESNLSIPPKAEECKLNVPDAERMVLNHSGLKGVRKNCSRNLQEQQITYGNISPSIPKSQTTLLIKDMNSLEDESMHPGNIIYRTRESERNEPKQSNPKEIKQQPTLFINPISMSLSTSVKTPAKTSPRTVSEASHHLRNGGSGQPVLNHPYLHPLQVGSGHVDTAVNVANLGQNKAEVLKSESILTLTTKKMTTSQISSEALSPNSTTLTPPQIKKKVQVSLPAEGCVPKEATSFVLTFAQDKEKTQISSPIVSAVQRKITANALQLDQASTCNTKQTTIQFSAARNVLLLDSTSSQKNGILQTLPPSMNCQSTVKSQVLLPTTMPIMKTNLDQPRLSIKDNKLPLSSVKMPYSETRDTDCDKEYQKIHKHSEKVKKQGYIPLYNGIDTNAEDFDTTLENDKDRVNLKTMVEKHDGPKKPFHIRMREDDNGDNDDITEDDNRQMSCNETISTTEVASWTIIDEDPDFCDENMDEDITEVSRQQLKSLASPGEPMPFTKERFINIIDSDSESNDSFDSIDMHHYKKQKEEESKTVIDLTTENTKCKAIPTCLTSDPGVGRLNISRSVHSQSPSVNRVTDVPSVSSLRQDSCSAKKYMKAKFIILQGDVCDKWLEVRRKAGFSTSQDIQFVHYLLKMEEARQEKAKEFSKEILTVTDGDKNNNCLALKDRNNSSMVDENRNNNSLSKERNISVEEDSLKENDEQMVPEVQKDMQKSDDGSNQLRSRPTRQAKQRHFLKRQAEQDTDSEEGQSEAKKARYDPASEQKSRLGEGEYSFLSKSVQKQMSWAVAVFRGWLKCQGEQNYNFEYQCTGWLNAMLERFYQEVHSKDSITYSANYLQKLRRFLSLYLEGHPGSKCVNISIPQDPGFDTSNQTLANIMKKRPTSASLDSQPIPHADFKRMYTSGTLSNKDPESLILKFWFDISYHLCSGQFSETFQKSLKKQNLTLQSDNNGTFYTFTDDVCLPPDEVMAKMYATSNIPERCPVRSTTLYLSNLCDENDALFQCPRKKWKDGGKWYSSVALSFETLKNMMVRISTKAKLSRIYKNSNVFATALHHKNSQ